jgi:uncharacterized protein (UPF0332 family)
MVSVEAKRTAEAHLRLAEGFIATAEVIDASSEVEIRNAFSRAYYAMFHAGYAVLLGEGNAPVVVERIAKEHGRLQSALRRPLGREFERYIRDLYDRRRQADYEALWSVPSASVARSELKRARGQFYWLLRTAQRSLA